MAKASAPAAQSAATAPEAPSDENLDLAARAIAGITGCGLITALARAEALPAKVLEQIGGLERSGKRDKIPAVLNAVPPKAQPKPEAPAKSK